MANVSIQLSVRGRPSAFDLSPSNDIIVVSSPGCMTFFHLNGLGVPRHVIHYEQPQQIRKVKYQKEGKLATLRGGIVSFWDPFHSLRPLLGLAQNIGWITDLDWSPTDNNVIATTCDKGEVRIFDIRAASTPLQTLHMGGACSSVSWCPSHANLIAACNREGFNVWDTRMLATSNNHQSDILWSDRSMKNQNVSNAVNQVTWTHSDLPCLVTASTSSHLTWWDGLTGERLGEGGEKLDPKDQQNHATSTATQQSPISCTLLSMPFGRGILTANRIACEQNREAPDGPSTIPRTLSSESLPSHFISEKSDTKDDVTSKIQTLVDVMDEIDNSGILSTPIWINSFPRKEYTLTNLFEPPSGKGSEQLVSSREQIVLCREPILGMRWCPPGRLLPPSQGGLELLLLSSVNSSLHAMSLSPEVVERYTTEEPYVPSGTRVKHDALKSNHRTPHMESTYKMNPPKYSISSLKRSMLTPKQLLEKNHVDQHPVNIEPLHNKTPSIGNTFYGQLQHEILLLEEALESESLSGLSISRIDQYARQITLEMLKPVLSTETEHTERKRNMSSASQGLYSGSRSGDEEDEVVADIEDNASDWDENGSLSSRDRAVSDVGDSLAVPCAVLIITFVQSLNAPSFTIRSLYDAKTCGNGGIAAANAALESELESVVHSFRLAAQAQSSTIIGTRDQLPSSHGFLLDVARYFRNRALQVWGGLSVFNGVPLVLKSINTVEGDADDDFQGDDIPYSTEIPTATKNQPDVIDPLSYRVPCPRTSGGIFSTLGYLSCFGGSRLFLKQVESFQIVDHTRSMSIELSNQERKGSTDDQNFPPTPVLPQRSHVTNLSIDQYPISTSESHNLQSDQSHSKPTSPPPSTMTVMYPKTYGDLLVYQRDSKINSQAKNKRRDEMLESNTLQPEGKLQAPPIKTTERYYEYFIHMQGRQAINEGTEDSGSDSESPSITDDDNSSRTTDTDTVENSDDISNHNKTPSGDNDISQNINLLEIESDHSVNDITSALNEPPSPQFQSKKKKKLASGKVPPDTENPSLKYSFSNPKEVQIYRVLGFMTQKLAKAYSFAVCSSTRQEILSFSLPYIRSFSDLSANRDPHFYKHVSGLSDSNLSSYIPSASHHIPRSGSLNNLSMENIGFGTRGFGESKVQIDVSSAHATKRSISTIDLTMTTTHPPTSPPPKQNFGQKVAPPVLHLRNGYEIAQTCRYNAQLAQSLKLASLFHIWTMLAVCFEMLSLAGMEYHPSKVSSVLLNDDNSTKKLESCRRMVISGLSYDWSRHALGRPLLRKIWRTLSHIGDLQTLSTIACTLGGPHATAYYLDEPNKYNPKALDRMLLRYSDILHRWQCHVEATEVSKYISESISDNSRALAGEDVSGHDLVSMKLEIKCSTCDRTIKNGNSQWCNFCKEFTQKCGVCEQVVRGFAFFCANCGHGGHPSHLRRWFEENIECPSGCGCNCGSVFSASALQDSMPSYPVGAGSNNITQDFNERWNTKMEHTSSNNIFDDYEIEFTN